MPQLYSAVLRKLQLRNPSAISTGNGPSHGQSSVRRSSRRSVAPRPAVQMNRAVLDALEGRVLFSVSYDAAGFTVVTPGDQDRVVYVSSSGSDSNYGFSAVAPVKTIAKAKSMVRAGYGDQMLLKRGDTFYESVGNWTKGGRDTSEPMVIGAYGSGNRPVVATGKASAMTTGSASAKYVNHLVIQGIRFYANQRDPNGGSFAGGSGGNEGLRLLAGTNNTLVEDVEVDSYTTNVTVAGFIGPASNIRIRRSIIVDAYNPNGHAQGLYADNVNGLALEENVFDHNGWNASVGGAGQTMYNHNVYIKESVGNFVARENLISNASSHGLQARSGGVVEQNTFVDNPIHTSFGLVNGGLVKAGGVTGRVANNLFQGGGNIGSAPRGWGVDLGNIQSATISGNVFTGAPTNSSFAISLNVPSGVSNAGSAVGINNLLIEDNVVHNWTKAVNITESMVVGGGGISGLRNVTIRSNDFQAIQKPTIMHLGADFSTNQIHLSGNRYHSPAGQALVNIGGPSAKWSQWAPGRDYNSQESRITYPGGNRSVSSYGSSIGVGSASGYIDAARKQREGNWRDNLTGSAAAAYVRNGYGLSGAVTGQPTPAPIPEPEPEPTTPSGTSTGTTSTLLRPTEDAFVRDGNYAGQNFGSNGDLEVRSSTWSGNSRKSYLKFDISQISSISSASLFLNGNAVQSGSMPMSVYAASSDSWSENTITWSNQPGTSGGEIAAFGPDVSGTTAKDYSAAFGQWLAGRKAAGEKIISLVVASPEIASTAGVFASSEGGSDGPVLVIKK